MKVEVNLQGVDGVLATLRSLPPEIVSKRGGPVKLALAKGARILRDHARQNLRAVIANGSDVLSTGLLEQNVVSTRGKAPAGGGGERYLVRVRRKTYPDRSGKPVTTHKTAHLLEYGSVHQPATPWLRPAVLAKGDQVISVVTADLVRRIELVVKKLAAQNRGR